MPRPVDNPPNPWLSQEVAYLEGMEPVADLSIYEDKTRSVLSKNDSPDIPFTWSVNPYRGCYHGCTYCYARPTHEYLGFGSGTDFERKLTVKPEAPRLLQKVFEQKKWKGDVVAFSGVTDCYQPLEASYQLTRQCLELCAEYKNPVSLITKAPLIVRDLDVLVRLHEQTSLTVTLSIPLWNPEAAHAIEPFVAPPKLRMKTIKKLADAGLDVGINVAPMIPGLSDRDIPTLLRQAREAGAVRAGTTFLRLPGNVQDVFTSRLRSKLPLLAEGVISKVRAGKNGKLNRSEFGTRMRGEGPYAEAAKLLFDQECDRLGFNQGRIAKPLEPRTFERPPRAGDQLRLL